MLAAIGLVFMRDGNEVALVATFAAVIGSFLVSLTRAKTERSASADVGLGSGVERVVVISVVRAGPMGLSSGRSEFLAAMADHRDRADAVRPARLGTSPSSRRALLDACTGERAATSAA